MSSSNNTLLLLLALTNADAKCTINEQKFIVDIATQLGISTEELTQLQKSFKHFKIEIPESEQERMTILYQLLFLMRIDAEIASTEKEMIHQIALKFGVHPDLTNDLINVMTEHLQKNIPIDALLLQIKKYMN